jgi:uncharacterized protein (DUF1778 family)
MTENNCPLAIRVTASARTALDHAAAADGVSIAQYIETALAGLLADAGYIENQERSA